MSDGAAERGAGEGGGSAMAGEPASVSSAQGPTPAPSEPLPPAFSRYLALNVGAWAFIGAMGFIFFQELGSPRGIVLLCAILAAGFTLASMFDYWWLRWGRRGG